MKRKLNRYCNGFPKEAKYVFQTMARFLKLCTLFFGGLGLLACTSQPPFLTVAAAASLRNLLDEIQTRFESQYPVKLRISFSASGVLRRQIEQGAPFDLFISAAEAEIKLLQEQGKIGPAQSFAQNRLVMVAARQAPPCPSSPQAFFKHFTEQRLAMGNPATVPAGRYAQEALTFYQQWQPLQPYLIQTSHVRQALDYTLRQEVDYGLVYASDYLAFQQRLQYCFTLPRESHRPIRFQLAPIQGGKPETAQLIPFLLAQQDLMRAYGFLPAL